MVLRTNLTSFSPYFPEFFFFLKYWKIIFQFYYVLLNSFLTVYKHTYKKFYTKCMLEFSISRHLPQTSPLKVWETLTKRSDFRLRSHLLKRCLRRWIGWQLLYGSVHQLAPLHKRHALPLFLSTINLFSTFGAGAAEYSLIRSRGARQWWASTNGQPWRGHPNLKSLIK